MIDLFRIKLVNAINQHKNLELVINTDEKNQAINEFVYPIGIIPINMIENNVLLKKQSITENSNYLLQSFNFLFDNIYTAEEKKIFIIYYLLRIYGLFILNSELIDLVMEVYQLSSEKRDVQYALEEIKYKLLLHLTSFSKITDQNLIEELINELEPIEASHNTFNLEERV